MQCAVVAGGVAHECLTIVTAAGGTTTSTSHTPPVTLVFIVSRVGEVVLRGPIQNRVLKISPVKVLLWAGGGGGATGVGILREGDFAGGGGPGGTVDALLVIQVHHGELLMYIVIGGEPVVLARLSRLLFLLVIPQGHIAIGQPAHTATIHGVPKCVGVQNAHSHGTVLDTVGAHFGTRPLQGRGPSGL